MPPKEFDLNDRKAVNQYCNAQTQAFYDEYFKDVVGIVLPKNQEFIADELDELGFPKCIAMEKFEIKPLAVDPSQVEGGFFDSFPW